MKAIRWSGAVAVAALTWSCSASPQVGDAEAMFRGGPAHPGVYAGIRSSPAVADGVVFVGGTDGSLHAVALATGEALWRHDTEGRSLESADFGFDRRSIQSSPVVGDGAVFFGSRDGHVYAVDAASGELRWRFDQEVSWCNTSPALMDGTVYAGTSDGLFVHALDARSGRELWRTPTRGRVFASPSLSGETLVVGDHSGTLWALDRFTGEARWSFRTRGAVQSSAVVHDSTVFVGSDDGFVYALRGTGGPSTRRAVFWDEAYPSLYQGHEALREAMESSGYPVLDADALAVFMAERVRDGLPSAVIFARDRVPEAVAATPSDTTLFRRYLEAGGRVVWLGLPPLSLLLDPETGQPVGLDLGRAGALLGVDHAGATMDEYTATATDVGLAWGLPGWWTDQLGVEPAEVITALALDERGRATSWVRRYGNGGAFVKLWGRLDAIPDADPVRHAAEHILR